MATQYRFSNNDEGRPQLEGSYTDSDGELVWRAITRDEMEEFSSNDWDRINATAQGGYSRPELEPGWTLQSWSPLNGEGSATAPNGTQYTVHDSMGFAGEGRFGNLPGWLRSPSGHELTPMSSQQAFADSQSGGWSDIVGALGPGIAGAFFGGPALTSGLESLATGGGLSGFANAFINPANALDSGGGAANTASSVAGDAPWGVNPHPSYPLPAPTPPPPPPTPQPQNPRSKSGPTKDPPGSAGPERPNNVRPSAAL